MYRNDLIVEAMAQKGFTNESLAHETGLTAATISALRQGKPNVQLPTLQVVAEALGLDMHKLFKAEKVRQTA